MAKIDNRVRKEDLNKKVDSLINDTPPVVPPKDPPIDPPVVVDPPIVAPVLPPTEEEKAILTDILASEPTDLTDDQQEYLEEHKADLTPEQQLAFGLIDKLPEKKVEPVKETNIDYKSRYAGSTVEAQVLASRNKEFLEATEKADALVEPTEDEMKTEYGEDWDTFTDRQKKNAKVAVLAQKRKEIIDEVRNKMKKGVEWTDATKKYVNDPTTKLKYKQLEGHEEEFVQFCSLPSRVGINYDDLVKAFSFDLKPVTLPPKRASLFEKGGGGGAAVPTVKELSADEVSFIRIHNPRKYKELILKKKINLDI